MHSEYRNPGVRELRDQQVRFAPRSKKVEQANRAEKLLGELDDERVYSYEYLCYRITDFRPESYPDLKITGSEAKHDLRLFVEDVSDSADVDADAAGETVMTVDDVSEKFNVSTKTVSRWRKQGLVSRRFVFGGRKRVGFLESSVRRFVEENESRVSRGSRFSQLTDEERDWIIERARRLARSGGCPAEVARRLGQRLGRSPETIRYTLKHHDTENPAAAIFPETTGPLSDATKQKVFRQYLGGATVAELAKQYCRTKASMYRLVGEMRARRVMDLPLDYIPSDEFPRRWAERTILGAAPPEPDKQRKSKVPADLPPYLASLYEVPLLNREQEQYLFRKYNYLKYRAARLRDTLDPARPKRTVMDDVQRLYEEAVGVKNLIIRSNLRLVVSIAKRHVSPGENFFELVSDGNISLIRAVEKFDYARGNKFSTYATWAIMKNFARSIPDELRRRDRFRTSYDEMFTATEDNRGNATVEEAEQMRRELAVGQILENLSEREQQIIIKRFGLNHDEEPLTLKEVGQDIGVTKERVRQIEARALSKLRQAVAENPAAVSGV
ncbi:MAG: sigma-70 family RNA polymerase sigma factor [Pirellulales bacterium]